MKWLRGWLWRARGLGRERRFEADLREQISTHLEEAIEEYARQGLPAGDARRAALRDFGSIVQTEETSRDVRGRWLQDLAKDAVAAVAENGDPVRLAPMNPFERKIVHDVVAAAGLVSESEGEEPQRRVVVLPKA